MNKRQAVIFDLDGTLLDSLADIAAAMNRVLAARDLPQHPQAAYRFMVGEGMATLVERALPPERRDPASRQAALDAMRADYGRNWHRRTRPYPKIPELLTALTTRDLILTILSNKPEEFTIQAARKLLPAHPFAIVRGARPDTPRKPDPAGALAIAEQLSLPPEAFLYVGDSGIDMRTAKGAGMFAVGILWGFRPSEELEADGADVLIANPLELLELLKP